MLRIFSSIIIFSSLVFFIVLFTGFIIDKQYTKTSTIILNHDIKKVFNIYSNVDNYLDNKKDLEKIEILERKYGSVTKWIEITKSGSSISYEILEKDEQNYFLRIRMEDKENKIIGVWDYKFEPINREETKITIIENSEIETVFNRGLRNYWDRNFVVNREMDWLKKALFNEEYFK